MRWVVVTALVASCVGAAPTSENPSGDQSSPEIDGIYFEVGLGVCRGGVGGEIRCGGPCNTIEDAPTCAATARCLVGLNDDATFRDCFPVDTRTTAVGACADLISAGDCVTREDCAVVYQGPAFYGSFVRCEAEAP